MSCDWINARKAKDILGCNHHRLRNYARRGLIATKQLPDQAPMYSRESVQALLERSIRHADADAAQPA